MMVMCILLKCNTNEHSVVDADRNRILEDMKRDFTDDDFEECIKNINSLFYHAVNVYYVYLPYGDNKCPAWFMEAYAKSLQKHIS